MKIAFLILLLALVAACAAPNKIYETDMVSCTWTEVEELIICRGVN